MSFLGVNHVALVCRDMGRPVEAPNVTQREVAPVS